MTVDIAVGSIIATSGAPPKIQRPAGRKDRMRRPLNLRGTPLAKRLRTRPQRLIVTGRMSAVVPCSISAASRQGVRGEDTRRFHEHVFSSTLSLAIYQELGRQGCWIVES